MMQVSVIMPLYRSKYIGWLAFESLKNQLGIDFEWELIIGEENTEEYLGKDTVLSYEKDLRKVGCVNLVYTPFKEWIPLSKKYRILTQQCSESKIWTIAVGDYYSATTRIASMWRSFKINDWDFYRTSNLIFYDFLNHKWVVRRVGERGACCKAVKMSIAKQVYYDDERRYGLDGWFYRQCLKIKPDLKTYVDNTYWKDGFNTHGFNNLSHDRTEKIKNNSHKFLPWDLTVSQFPPSILEQLNKTVRYLDKHRIGNFK